MVSEVNKSPESRFWHQSARLMFFSSWFIVAGLMLGMFWFYYLGDLETAFFTHDSEIELVAARSISDSGFTRMIIPWSRAYESGHEQYLPFGSNFVTVQDHHFYIARPVYYLLLSAIGYYFAGTAGVYIFPALSFLVILWLTSILLPKLDLPISIPGIYLALPVAAFSVPLLFYGLCFWSMIMGAVFIMGSVVASISGWKSTGWMFIAGFLAVIGAGFRPEVLFFCGLLLLWVAVFQGWKKAIAAIGGGSVSFGILSVVNYVAFGHFMGAHIGTNQLPAEIWTTRLETVYRLILVSPAPRYLEIAALLGICLALIPSSVKKFPVKIRMLGLWMFTVGAGIFMVWNFIQPDPYRITLENHSIFASCPFVMFTVFFDIGESGKVRFLRYLSVSCAGIIILLCPLKTAYAAHWGPRVLVSIMPVLAVISMIAAIAYLRRFPSRCLMVAVILLFTISCADQIYSLKLLMFKKNQTAIFKAEINQYGGLPLITDRPMLTHDLASWYTERPLFSPRSSSELDDMINMLLRENHSQILVIASPETDFLKYFKILEDRNCVREITSAAIQASISHYSGMKIVKYDLIR
jgi:hypothetical protein